MFDRFALLIVGVVCSVLAWAGWHYAGASWLDALIIASLVAYAVERFLQRRKLRVERNARDKADGLRRLMSGLLAVRDSRGETHRRTAE